ncbi:MAG: hypothetical protein ABI267_05680 [Ginsengibacter sp.]
MRERFKNGNENQYYLFVHCHITFTLSLLISTWQLSGQSFRPPKKASRPDKTYNS